MIYRRYLFKEHLKTFFLFLLSFYFVYVAIDYSTHMRDFIADEKINLSRLVSYYGFHFIKRSFILIPLALMIATIRLLLFMNTQGELTTLQASGISKKAILLPLFYVGSVATLLGYATMEYAIPQALNYLDRFEEGHFKGSSKKIAAAPFHTLYLTDGSLLVYQKLDPLKNLYFDAFWIRSNDDIFRIKYLSKDFQDPIAYCVDHLQRGPGGSFEKKESFLECRLPPLEVKKVGGKRGTTPPENTKISQLFMQQNTPQNGVSPSERLTYLLLKLTLPLTCLLATLAPIPFCLRHCRALPVFLIYTLSLFGLITFFTCIDAGVILGENHTLPPSVAILTPFILVSAALFYFFKREILH